MPKKCLMHTTARHDPSCDGADWEGCDAATVFMEGAEYLVPDEVFDYFQRAGWASEPGGEATEPPVGKTITLDIHNLVNHQKAKI